jgi:hypothetical protein
MFGIMKPLIRLATLLIVLFTAVLLLIHAQYDDHELRQLLLPDGCPAPCFMGIRPGVTTADDAIQILKANLWVKKVGYGYGSTTIYANWRTDTPIMWLDKSYVSTIFTANGMVTEIRVSVSLTLADIQLMFGRTPFHYVEMDYDNGNGFLYSAIYPNTGAVIYLSKNCNDRTDRITYHDNVILYYRSITGKSDFPYPYENTWADVLSTSCR